MNDNNNVVGNLDVNQVQPPVLPAQPPAYGPVGQDQSPVEQPMENRPFYLKLGFWIFVFLLGNLVVAFFLWAYPLISPPIVVQNQPVSETFRIIKARIPSIGFLVIHADLLVNDQPLNSLIAASGLLIPDTYDNIFLRRSDNGETLDEFASRIQPNSVLLVSLYNDSDGDGLFNPNIDISVVKDILGRKIEKAFIVQ